MILYKATAGEFCEAVDDNKIADLVEKTFAVKLGHRVNQSQKRAFINSLPAMERVLRRAAVPSDCGILIEYIIPLTSNRIDFVIAGEDSMGKKNVVIIELKQWDLAQSTDMDGVVKTFIGGGNIETTHPSYQANSYKTFLGDFNEHIFNGTIRAYACAYLHNYPLHNPEPLKAEIYQNVIEEAPLYLKDDVSLLADFIQKHVGKGKGMNILYEVDSGKIRPSKQLIDYVSSMYQGNQEFVLLDEQKIAYETAKNIAKKNEGKSVIIINGGPGTGKSVLSMNLLGGLLKENLNVAFVAPNASYRDTLIDKLAQNERRTRLYHLFKGSAGFTHENADMFDVLVVDEAHRLKKRGAYQYKGENQVEDLVKVAKTTIFFIDDDQMIRPDDIGSVKEIRRVAEKFGAQISEIELVAQFRCAGAEGYVNWVNDILQIKETANFDGWDQKDFDFKIFDNPNEMRAAIQKKHEEGYNARMLAGYAWKWTGQKDGNANGEVNDVVIPVFDFSMPWNSRKVGTTWASDPRGIHQLGCVHTSQGLEFDYVGIIVGKDLSFDPVSLKYTTDWSEYKDATGKKGLKDNPEELNRFVRNIYRVLMTRGKKGCYVYFMDEEVKKQFKDIK
ncbi:MAG: DUF2075 domain-containing protein [Candidatus Gracilibacteria bacterium]